MRFALRFDLFVGFLVLACAAGPPAASAQTYHYGFDKDTGALSGTDGWEGAYCADPWATHLNGGVTPLTDDGCWIIEGCSAYNHCGYEFGYGAYCQESDPFDNHIQVGSKAWADYVYTARFKNTDDDAVGLMFRYQNSGQFYLFLMTRDCAPNPDLPCTDHLIGSRLMRIKDLDATVVASSAVTYDSGTVHTARITVEGDHITADLDLNEDGEFSADENVFDIVDNAGLDSGKVGLYAYENGYAGLECMTGDCWFDDVTVTLLAAPPDPCNGISYEGVCEGNTLKYCDDGALSVYSCADCCQWVPYQGYYNCVNQYQCAGSSCQNECYQGEIACSGELTHQMTCGQTDDDSCLERIYQYCVGSGFCDPATGQCATPACTPACAAKECGDDGCGGTCGQCASPQDECQNGLCSCLPYCAGKECGDDGCGDVCGMCGEGYKCNDKAVCEKKEPCAPRFSKECVDNSVFWFDSCGDIGELVEQCDGLCLGNECVPATIDHNTSDVVESDAGWVWPEGGDDFGLSPGPDTSGSTWDGSGGAGGDAVSSFSAGARSGGCAHGAVPEEKVPGILLLLLLSLGRRDPAALRQRRPGADA